MMNKVIRIGLTGLAFVIFNFGSAFLSWVLIPYKRWRFHKLLPDANRRAMEDFLWACNRWIVGIIQGLGLIEFQPPQLPANFPRGRPFVMVANHPTLLDVLLIKATIPGVTCVVKSSLYHRKHIHQLLRAAGDFPGPSQHETVMGTTSVLDTFVERLKLGFPVLVFPEGTRSPPWGLSRFHRGASEAAFRAKTTIIPVFITSDPPMLLKNDRWFNVRTKTSKITLEILPSINYEDRTAAELHRELTELYKSKIKALDPASRKINEYTDPTSPR